VHQLADAYGIPTSCEKIQNNYSNPQKFSPFKNISPFTYWGSVVFTTKVVGICFFAGNRYREIGT
jgi:hypothetical protein